MNDKTDKTDKTTPATPAPGADKLAALKAQMAALEAQMAQEQKAARDGAIAPFKTGAKALLVTLAKAREERATVAKHAETLLAAGEGPASLREALGATVTDDEWQTLTSTLAQASDAWKAKAGAKRAKGSAPSESDGRKVLRGYASGFVPKGGAATNPAYDGWYSDVLAIAVKATSEETVKSWADVPSIPEEVKALIRAEAKARDAKAPSL